MKFNRYGGGSGCEDVEKDVELFEELCSKQTYNQSSTFQHQALQAEGVSLLVLDNYLSIRLHLSQHFPKAKEVSNPQSFLPPGEDQSPG